MFVCVPVVALGPDRHPLPVEATVRIAGEGATCSYAHHVDVIPDWLISLFLICTSYDSTIDFILHVFHVLDAGVTISFPYDQLSSIECSNAMLAPVRVSGREPAESHLSLGNYDEDVFIVVPQVSSLITFHRQPDKNLSTHHWYDKPPTAVTVVRVVSNRAGGRRHVLAL